LFGTFDNWFGSGDETLRDFDIYFRLRRLFHVLYRVPKPMPGESWESVISRLAKARIGRQIKLLEVIASAMERLVDQADISWENLKPEELWTTVLKAYQKLLNAEGLLSSNYQISWTKGDRGNDWLRQCGCGDVEAVCCAWDWC
jgi:hypothetical protein